MLKTPLYLTVAALIGACPAFAFAQAHGGASISPSNARGSVTSPTSGEASTTAIVGNDADADTAFATEFYRGRAVKDNAGKKIGDIASIQEDASGHRTITVKMGGQNVTLDAAQFAIHNDAVLVRLSHEQLSAMLQPPEN